MVGIEELTGGVDIKGLRKWLAGTVPRTQLGAHALDSVGYPRSILRARPSGRNPRFVVTFLSAEKADVRTLYGDLCYARSDMENRIEDQQLDLLTDRTSTWIMRANQIRSYFSSFAYACCAP